MLKEISDEQKAYDHAIQQEIAELFGINSQLFNLSQDQLLKMANKMIAIFTPYANVTDDIQNRLSAALNYFSTQIPVIATIGNISSSLNTLSSVLNEITIHNTYVEVPKSLIPDNFSCDEIDEDSTDASNEIIEVNVPIKKLSFSNTLTIIEILINILIFAITSIQTNQSSLQEQRNHDERIAIEKDANSLQGEQNQIIQSQVEELEKQTEYLVAIYNKIEETGSASPEFGSPFPDTDSAPLNPSSPSQCGGSSQPKEVDEPDGSGTLRKTD